MRAAVQCILPGTDLLGESPLWCERTQSLLWLDIDGGRLQRWHPASGRHDTFAFDDRYVGSLALTQQTGQVLLGIDLALVRFDLGTGERRLLCQVEPAEIDNRLNDGRCDARGRFWVGTMDNQLHRPQGAFYRVDPDGAVHKQFGDVIVSNTVAFSRAQDRLYFSDTRRFTTWQFGLDAAAGTLGERRVFVDHTAARWRPDGACVDAEGFVWNAIFAAGRVVRYSPAGEVDRVIDLPVTNPTCVCLGGPELQTLYITTARKFLDRAQLRAEPWAGSVLAVEVDVPGLLEHRFG
ncbi:SMP-30/gluconolactonase/LRE family protein [Caenimonas sedimenti]|uniref:SMP-30/gluconolactonase/LRE family protein n=1 Tax=Caenimonas sedimenti TaxID=2596921 RepID=A0A562ZJE7_9BURK|nr:SMP-30/gluconolactonase/LRE family protein [Caenimonas sedimenti]TWO68445.1 SMP-30/gluconolactonase/LRE family protein [Caenimonas sedimenti]